MKKWFWNLTFRNKIILTFFVILVFNAGISSTAYFWYADAIIFSNYEKSAMNMISQMNIHLSDRFQRVSDRVNALFNNMSFVITLRGWFFGNGEDTAIVAGVVADMLSDIRLSDNMIDSVYIYTEKSQFDDYSLPRAIDVDFSDTYMYRYFKDNPEVAIKWFPAMRNSVYREQSVVIPVIYRKLLGNNEVFFVVNISQSELGEYLTEFFASFDRVIVRDEDGGNIINGDYEASDEYLSVSSTLTCNGWRIVALTRKDTLTLSQKRILLFVLWITIITIIACLLFILLMSDRLTASLKELSAKMSLAGEGNYSERFRYPYTDEVGQLVESYNNMLETIQFHIRALEEEKENVKRVQRQKRKMEFQALQSQINPHFLYNTLNMITWQAIDQGADEISIISTALGKYFRISLSRGHEVISLADELEHVKSYLEIQKIRYESKLQYEFSVPQEMMNYKIPKLLLQPLVENALYHGLKEKEGGGTIWISAEEHEDNLRLIVSDDGLGIEPLKLHELNIKLSAGITDSKSGYGIFNVNNRVRLFYGELYGLHIETREEGGVLCVLTLAKTVQEEI